MARSLLYAHWMAEPLIFSGVVIGSMLMALAATRSVLGLVLHAMAAGTRPVSCERRPTAND